MVAKVVQCCLSPDPLADLSRKWSPYVYGYNNPLKFIDPDGMYNSPFQRTDDLTNDQWINATRIGADRNLAQDYREVNRKKAEEENPKIKMSTIIKNFDDHIKGRKVKDYTLVLYAAQPWKGNNWWKLNPFAPYGLVGHSFIMLRVNFEAEDGGYENDPSYAQVFGFYPDKGGGNVLDLEAKGSTFRNNTGHPLSSAISKNMGEWEFKAILQFAKSTELTHYNLIDNNCTTFAVQAANIAGINISGRGPIPIPYPIPGNPYNYYTVEGENPANLGQNMIDRNYTGSGIKKDK